MPKQSYTETRALLLTRKHGVAQKDVTGAYHTPELRCVEFLLHEVSHWVTLGRELEKLPKDLTKRIADTFERLTKPSADSLEFDASIVTYVTGYLLGLWEDPIPIVNSCRRNLSGLRSLTDTDAKVLEIFRSKWGAHQRVYLLNAKLIAKWFRPSCKLKELSGIFPEAV